MWGWNTAAPLGQTGIRSRTSLVRVCMCVRVFTPPPRGSLVTAVRTWLLKISPRDVTLATTWRVSVAPYCHVLTVTNFRWGTQTNDPCRVVHGHQESIQSSRNTFFHFVGLITVHAHPVKSIQLSRILCVSPEWNLYYVTPESPWLSVHFREILCNHDELL